MSRHVQSDGLLPSVPSPHASSNITCNGSSFNLETLIQMMCTDSDPLNRRKATETVRSFCRDDGENRKQVVRHGCLPILSQLVSCSDPETGCHAVASLHNIVLSAELVPALMADETIRALIYALDHNTVDARSTSAVVIYYLARHSPENAEKIASFDELYGPLMAMLKGSNFRLKKDATYVMGHISLGEIGRRRLVEEGVVGVLVNLLEEEGEEMEAKVLPVLFHVSKCEEGVDAILAADSLDCITDLLDSRHQSSREFSIGILLQIVSHSDEGLRRVKVGGLIPTIWSIFRSETVSPRWLRKADLLIKSLRGPSNETATLARHDSSLGNSTREFQAPVSAAFTKKR